MILEIIAKENWDNYQNITCETTGQNFEPTKKQRYEILPRHGGLIIVVSVPNFRKEMYIMGVTREI